MWSFELVLCAIIVQSNRMNGDSRYTYTSIFFMTYIVRRCRQTMRPGFNSISVLCNGDNRRKLLQIQKFVYNSEVVVYWFGENPGCYVYLGI